MSFLGTEAGLFADTTFIAETAGFLILLSGAVYVRRKNFLKHDKLSKIAILTGVLSFIWMGFSLVSDFLERVSLNPAGLLIISHAMMGLLALFMGMFLVLGEMKKTKRVMWAIFSSWTAAMVLGVILYIDVYIP